MGTTPAPHPGAFGQLSVLVGAVAVTSLDSVRPWEALCPRVPTQIHAEGHRHPCNSVFPTSRQGGQEPGEKRRRTRPKGSPTDRRPQPDLFSPVPRDPRGGDAGPGLARADSRPGPGGAGQGQGRE